MLLTLNYILFGLGIVQVASGNDDGWIWACIGFNALAIVVTYGQKSEKYDEEG